MVQRSTACTGLQGLNIVEKTLKKRTHGDGAEGMCLHPPTFKDFCSLEAYMHCFVFPAERLSCIEIHMPLFSVMTHGMHFQDGRSGPECSLSPSAHKSLWSECIFCWICWPSTCMTEEVRWFAERGVTMRRTKIFASVVHVLKYEVDW